ncbi:MAG: polyribonucleotide nucleotidyltransferase [Actinomycetota bacterium]
MNTQEENMHKETRSIGGTDITFEAGKLAEQALGAVVTTIGETTILATCTSSNPREGIDFFPLTVDVEERMYAVGKIPGSFFRREGRPSETGTLTARLIDRPLRPTFRDGFRDEVHVVILVLSADHAQPYDIPGINGAGLAVTLAGLPFDGPVAGVRVAMIGGQWKVNPTYQDVDLATFDMVVAGRKNDQGGVDILMIEGEAPDVAWHLIQDGSTAPTEETVSEGLEVAKQALGEIIDFQREFAEKAGIKDRPFVPKPLYTEEVYAEVITFANERMRDALVPEKVARQGNIDKLKEELAEHLMKQWGADRHSELAGEVKAAFKALEKKLMRRRVIEDGIRLDGRKTDEIRPLSAEVGTLPRAHGSGLFSRGQTQVLNVTTLGMLRMTAMIDTLDPEDSKRYMHHYNFPPFSTGETGFMRGPKRREIGHGALAERALVPVIPTEDEFPYALRLVSDVLSSNGSTSMASVCASTLSLMHAGVPIKAPVAGIAMGLIADAGEFVTLTDILGAEDALGDMDFKVAGTKDWITAIQLDMKITGMPSEVLAGALKQAKEARLQILDVMAGAIADVGPMSDRAPRVMMVQIPIDKIGEVIGPKGKRINEIIALTGADIDINDDGRVFIGSHGGDGAARAIEMIEQIANPVMPEVGQRYQGKVVKTTTFGAFVNLTPGKDGLVHISRLGGGQRVTTVEDVVREGDEMEVEVLDVDRTGRISLRPISIRGEALPEPTEEQLEAMKAAVSDRPSGPRDRDRGGRGGDGGDRGGRGGDRDGGERRRPPRERRPGGE